jgi:hypothetical protein
MKRFILDAALSASAVVVIACTSIDSAKWGNPDPCDFYGYLCDSCTKYGCSWCLAPGVKKSCVHYADDCPGPRTYAASDCPPLFDSGSTNDAAHDASEAAVEDGNADSASD